MCFRKKNSHDASKAHGSEVREMKLDKYDPVLIRRYIAEFLIDPELPFTIVEGSGFRKLCNSLEPRFKMVSQMTVLRDCIGIYLSECNLLKEQLLELDPRVCLTTDTLTSIQNTNYMSVTAHFIDSSWKLHKKILGFRKISDHKGVSISKGLEDCMNEWGRDKVLTITVDNATNNDTALDNLKEQQLITFSDVVGGTICQHANLHMRCAAHILNHVVKDGLKMLYSCVQKMRVMVKFVKGSPERIDFFKKCVAKVGLGAGCGFLQMDVPIRWNSTYIMLVSVQKNMKAFEEMLDDEDGSPFAHLTECKEKEKEAVGTPTSWINLLGIWTPAILKMARVMQMKYDKYKGELTADNPIKLLLNNCN